MFSHHKLKYGVVCIFRIMIGLIIFLVTYICLRTIWFNFVLYILHFCLIILLFGYNDLFMRWNANNTLILILDNFWVRFEDFRAFQSKKKNMKKKNMNLGTRTTNIGTRILGGRHLSHQVKPLTQSRHTHSAWEISSLTEHWPT